MSDVVCLHHDDCFDGMGAAWAVSKKFPDVECIGVRYNEPLPKALSGKIVYIVDFCYPLPTLIALSTIAGEVHVLDHHKGMDKVIDDYNWAMNFLGFDVGKYNAIFDKDRSGAKLTWETLLPEYCTPAIIDFISDRDLWLFDLDETKAVMAGLGSYPLDVVTWDRLFRWSPDFNNRADKPAEVSIDPHFLAMNTLEDDGHVILRKMQLDADRLIKLTRRTITLSGYEVPLVNMPRTLVSEALEILAKGQPFAVSYFDSADFREFSLRSAPDGVDLLPIAKQYVGGGGHSNAAGFRVPRDHPLAQY
jgi:oligoribonuclease NrnB/cAMP/cGMP phosphodiesterase (DHH superfamily)